MQNQHALQTSADPFSFVRYADLAVLVLALPIFLVAQLPLLGWGTSAVAWCIQRALQVYLNRRAAASDDPRTVAGLLAGSMIARGWFIALAVFAAGMVEREAGLAAAVLCLSLFTVYLSVSMLTRPFEAGGGRR
jgi:hypothetical protein